MPKVQMRVTKSTLKEDPTQAEQGDDEVQVHHKTDDEERLGKAMLEKTRSFIYIYMDAPAHRTELLSPSEEEEGRGADSPVEVCRIDLCKYLLALIFQLKHVTPSP
ncbi:hypothetical protein AHAS_Ahas11G0116800 [Arachis hypogaea]